MSLRVFFTLTDRASTTPSNMYRYYAVANPVHGLLDRSKEHRPSSNKSIKIKSKNKNDKKKGNKTNQDEKTNAKKDRCGGIQRRAGC